jgi:glutamine synthetase adenylyltransferase
VVLTVGSTLKSFTKMASRYKKDNGGYLPFRHFESVREALKKWVKQQTDEKLQKIGAKALKMLNDGISLEKRCYHKLSREGFGMPRKHLEEIADILDNSVYTRMNGESNTEYNTLTNLISKWLRQRPNYDEAIIALFVFRKYIFFSKLISERKEYMNSLFKNTIYDLFDKSEMLHHILIEVMMPLDNSKEDDYSYRIGTPRKHSK